MKRYHVCAFPSLLGTPIKTNSKSLAYLIVMARMRGIKEIRVIDRKTGNHILVL